MKHMGRHVASQPGEGEREIFEGTLTLFEPEKFDGVKDTKLSNHIVPQSSRTCLQGSCHRLEGSRG